MSSDTAAFWRAADVSTFDTRQWDEDLVLYMLASGETHALAWAHSATFLTLLEQPGTAQTASYWLAAMSAEDETAAAPHKDDATDLQALVKVLADLHSIGVVERLSA